MKRVPKRLFVVFDFDGNLMSCFSRRRWAKSESLGSDTVHAYERIEPKLRASKRGRGRK